MSKTTTYITGQLVLTTTFITAVLTCAVWLTQSLRFVDIVVNKGLSFSVFFHLIFYLLPDLIGIVLPISLLIALLFVYNRLYADHELVVMRATGMSNWQLAKPAVIVSCIITIVLYSITMYFLPQAFRGLKDLEHKIRHTVSTAMLQEGQFTTIKGLTVFVRERSSSTDVLGIIIYDARDAEKPYTITAETGSILPTKTGERIVLLNGVRQELNQATGYPSTLRFDQHIIDLNSSPQGIPNRYRKPYEYFLFDLLNPSDDIASTLEQKNKLRSRGHYNILIPLFAISFTLIGLSLLLGGDYNRRGRPKRILMIVLLCCALQTSIFGLMHLYDWLFLAVPLAYAVLITVILLSLGYLREWFVPSESLLQVKV